MTLPYGILVTSQDPAYYQAVGDGVPLPVGLYAWDGAAWTRFYVASQRIDQNAVDIHAITTVWTPAAGKSFRLLGGSISMSAAVSVLFEDNGAGNYIWRTPVLVANAPYNFDLGPEGYLASAAGNVLKATGSGAGTLTGVLYGTVQ